MDPWLEAVGLIHRWLEQRERLDVLLEHANSAFSGVERSRLQYLIYGVLRQHLRLDRLLSRRLQHPPRHRVQAILLLAAYELLETQKSDEEPGRAAKIVHHAVEKSKTLVAPEEGRLINAVLRRASEELLRETPLPALARAEVLAERYSHPEWLVRRWLALYGAEPTRRLLEWNQSTGDVYVRLRGPLEPALQASLLPSPWEGFFKVGSGQWDLVEQGLRQGSLYVQDPSTRLAVDLLKAQPGESVLDLCAAPGGKSMALGDALGTGCLVAVDLPGERQERLRENLNRLKGVTWHQVEADVLRNLYGTLKQRSLPLEYDGLLIDVPCSNTGVMRHRVDVKERIVEADFQRHARQQLQLVETAARFLRRGGRLVYSTCSIDPEENESVVKAFLKRQGEAFTLESKVLSFPWEQGHDGAGAFLLRRT